RNCSFRCWLAMSLSARARSSASEGGCFCWAGNEEAGKRPKRAGTAARIEMANLLRIDSAIPIGLRRLAARLQDYCNRKSASALWPEGLARFRLVFESG